MKRRDFLNPKHLVRGAGVILEPLQGSEGTHVNAPSDAAALLRVAREAMATSFEILLPFGMPDGVATAEAALDLVDTLEAQLTVYRDQSELSRLNRLAAAASVPVEPRLYALLRACARLSEETGGAFDVTSGPLIKAWGFFRRQGRVPSLEEREEVLQRVGMKHVLLDDERRTVRFLRPGMEINLGSVGKGYALDRAAEVLRSRNSSAALLHGGHSSVYAIGTRPGDPRGWGIGIRHPWEPARRIATVRLRDRGLATSAATFQHLEHEGRRLGHILDPRSGWPAEGIASVTVLASTAAEADALATAFFVGGIEMARAYVTTHPDVAVVLLPDGEDARLEFLGLADTDFDMHPPAP